MLSAEVGKKKITLSENSWDIGYLSECILGDFVKFHG